MERKATPERRKGTLAAGCTTRLEPGEAWAGGRGGGGKWGRQGAAAWLATLQDGQGPSHTPLWPAACGGGAQSGLRAPVPLSPLAPGPCTPLHMALEPLLLASRVCRAELSPLRHWVMLTAREKPGPQRGLDSRLLCPPEETAQAAAGWTGTLQRPSPRSRLPLTQGLTQPGDPRRRKSKPHPLLAVAQPPRGPCTLTQART